MLGKKFFGKKNVAPPVPSADPLEGHRHVLAHLAREEAEKPLQRAQVAGHIVFDLIFRILQTDRGCRIEDLVATLAATGGFSCVLAAVSEFGGRDINDGTNDLVTVQTQNGQKYIFGNLTNKYVFESQHSLLSLAMGAAQHVGASLSVEDVNDAFAHVSKTLGDSSFGTPRLPKQNMPALPPVEMLRSAWSRVDEALVLYAVNPQQKPTAIGFALAEAIDKGHTALDPRLLAQIAIEYAIPTSKLWPDTVGPR